MIRLGARRRPRVVLVVEDEQMVRGVQRDALEQLGCAVLEAGCGTEAIAVADGRRGTIDVLVTDLSLPGLRGPELAERLLVSRPELGVVFTSGWADERSLRDRFPESRYLQKPFTLEALAEAVAAFDREPLPAR